MKAGSACFGCGDSLSVFGHLGIPARRDSNRHRHDGAQAVDHVEREQQRNLQARLFDRNVLQSIEFCWVVHEQQRTCTARSNFVLDALRFLRLAEIEVLGDLTRLLFRIHPRQQRVGACAYFEIGQRLGRGRLCRLRIRTAKITKATATAAPMRPGLRSN